MKQFIIVLVLIVSVFRSGAQAVSVKSQLDTNQLLLGDQVVLTTTITAPAKAKVTFPIYTDTIVTGIEIIENKSIDTVVANSSTQYIQKLVISSFDTGAYMIPVGPFIVNGVDTVWGNSVFVSVNTMPIDTTKSFNDIKMPYEAPFTLLEILPIILWILVGLIIIGIVLYVIYRLQSKEGKNLGVSKAPLEPAHIVAIRELEKLKAEKLWQAEKVKEYYSRLTEIIRVYIEYQFNISALEQTTDQILSEFHDKKCTEKTNIDLLDEVFHTADLVKFAKYIPTADVHELSYTKMYDFVQKSKSEAELFKTEEIKKEE